LSTITGASVSTAGASAVAVEDVWLPQAKKQSVRQERMVRERKRIVARS
jgi:hypothetical protein